MTALVFVLPPESYLHDILHSFAVQAMFGYAALGVLASFSRSTTMTIAALSASLLVAGGLYTNQSLYPAESNGTTQTRQDTILRVAHFNVLCTNQQFERALASALATQADFVSFQEVSVEWGDHLKRHLSDTYPYFHMVTDEQNPAYGLAVFSKYPVKNVRTIYWSGLPNIAGDLQLPREEVHFLASHTLSPRSRGRYRKRNQHIRQIADYINVIDRPIFAIGDYNVVPWNPVIQEFRNATRLQDSHLSWEPTFPARWSGIGIPIDYIFHSPDIHCQNFTSFPIAGSDHQGIVGEYLLKSKG